MSLKNEIEKTMFKEGIEDRIQDIATFMDIPVENVKKRLKTLTFSDYIEVMSSLKTKDKDKIERIMGMPARDPNWKSPIDDVDDEEGIISKFFTSTDDEEEQHRRDVKHGLYGDDDEEDGASAEDLVDIIMHRIKQNKKLMLALLGDEGPGPLMNAVEDVADQYSGTTEVGSSDVSAMVDAVKRTLFPLDYRNFKVGDKVKANGFPGVITVVHTDVRKGMVDVKLKRGTTTVSMKDVQKEE